MYRASDLVRLERKFGGRTGPILTGDSYAHGGDRMGQDGHGYAEAYAEWLPLSPRVVVEVGILTGIGLAIWSELFPGSQVIGLDREPHHVRWEDLRNRGAFPDRDPEVYRADQISITAGSVAAILNGRWVDVVIDDASHVDRLTLRTIEAFRPHLAPGSRYFVEDRPRGSRIHEELHGLRGFRAHRVHRSLTVLEAG